jgi:hypothetical protein
MIRMTVKDKRTLSWYAKKDQRRANIVGRAQALLALAISIACFVATIKILMGG